MYVFIQVFSYLRFWIFEKECKMKTAISYTNEIAIGLIFLKTFLELLKKEKYPLILKILNMFLEQEITFWKRQKAVSYKQ